MLRHPTTPLSRFQAFTQEGHNDGRPFELRWRAAFDHELALALARITQAEIERRYRRLARKAGLREPRGGAVTVMQRFSSDLRTNLHFHELAPDGAYGVDANGRRRFFTAPAPTPAEACPELRRRVEQILVRIVRRARAHIAELDSAALDDDELALTHTLDAASRTSGAEAHAPDDAGERHLGIVLLPTRRKARIDGFDPSTSLRTTPRSASKSASATGSSTWLATSCVRPSPSTA